LATDWSVVTNDDITQRAPETRSAYRAFLLAPFAVVAIFFTTYASRAWFVQDDFNFYRLYHATMRPSQLFTFSDDFGRFFSRNVYWFFSIKFFGQEAPAFFLLNALIIAGTSYLIYKIFEERIGGVQATLAAFLYFGAPAVVSGYSFISNEQHFIPDLMIFLWVYLYLRWASAPWTWLRVATLVVVDGLALSSNVYALVLVLLPITMWLFFPQRRKVRAHTVLIGLMTLGTSYYIVRVHQFAVGTYRESLTFSTLHSNLQYYFGTKMLAIAIPVLVIGLWRGWRTKNALLFWLFVGSVATYLPYAFLVDQHYRIYESVFGTFFLLGALLLVSGFVGATVRREMIVVPIAMFLVMVGVCNPVQSYWNANPNGAVQHTEITQQVAFEAQHPNVTSYCYEEAAPVPAMWAKLSHGRAFGTFASSTDSYRFVESAAVPASCQALGILSPSGMTLTLR
jgi:hypothetical protein